MVIIPSWTKEEAEDEVLRVCVDMLLQHLGPLGPQADLREHTAAVSQALQELVPQPMGGGAALAGAGGAAQGEGGEVNGILPREGAERLQSDFAQKLTLVHLSEHN